MSDSESNDDGYVVKLRGLPWSATVDDILKFLGDIGVDKVHLTLSKEGRPSGEAFVELETEEDLMRAEEKDKKHMGSRYIEVFKVNRAEMDWVVKRSGASYDGNDDGCVRLRGLPFGCSKEEIAQFFTDVDNDNYSSEPENPYATDGSEDEYIPPSPYQSSSKESVSPLITAEDFQPDSDSDIHRSKSPIINIFP